MKNAAANVTTLSLVRARSVASAAALALSLGLGGCAGQGGDMLPGLLAAKQPAPHTAPGSNEPAVQQSELEQATEYWGKKFAEKPSDLQNALSYARNLKAMGQKKQALAALQQAASYHGQSKELAGEYGRLALELDHVKTAKPLLAFADDVAKPDWRIVSARGTVLAKEGSFKEAIPFFERAMALSNSHPSVMNNLAMAHAMSGEPERSEQILRQAAVKGGTGKVRQNLALVLGLQGKYDEATVVSSKSTSASVAEADTALVRKMVRLEPKTAPLPPAPVQVANGTAAAPPTGAAAQVALKPSTLPAPVASGSWQPQVATAAPTQPQAPALRPSR